LTLDQGSTPLHKASLYNASRKGRVAAVQALLSGGAYILAANNSGQLPIHLAVEKGISEVVTCLLQQQTYATTRRLPLLHELLHDLTWIVDQSSIPSDVPPLREALNQNVLGTDDVVEIIEYLVVQNHELISSRDQDARRKTVHFTCTFIGYVPATAWKTAVNHQAKVS
jgi:ankyrin repeat protein